MPRMNTKKGKTQEVDGLKRKENDRVYLAGGLAYGQKADPGHEAGGRICACAAVSMRAVQEKEKPQAMPVAVC